MTNAQLKKIIQRIEVDKDGNVEIFLRLLGDLGLTDKVLIADNKKPARRIAANERINAPNIYDRT